MSLKNHFLVEDYPMMLDEIEQIGNKLNKKTGDRKQNVR